MLFSENRQKQSESLFYGKLLRGALLGMFLLSGGMPEAVFAQDLSNRDVISLQNQIDALKSQVTQLQQMQSLSGDSKSSGRSSKGDSQGNIGDANGLLPELLTRVNNLEDQQRVMRGQLDDLTNQVQTQMALLNKKIDDANFAAGKDDSGTSASAAGSSTPATASVPTTPKATVSSGKSLKDGQQALISKNYSESESIARNIINTPQGKKSVPAHFLLAQSLAGQQRYKDASIGYFDIYKKFPDSTRAPEALLGVSITLMKNGDNSAACQALGLLKNKYPSASTRIKDAATSLNKKAKCS